MTTATSPALPGVEPERLLRGLVLDNGEPWGACATERQIEDAHAVLSLPTDARPAVPRQHYLTRPRGGSKSTDGAALRLVVLLTQAPPGSTSHAYAADADQAALILDKVRQLAQRSGLGGAVSFTSRAVEVIAPGGNGARLVVEPADAPSAFGHTPYLVLLDEAANWPDTESYRVLRRAIFGGLAKRPDSRLVVLTSAGAPGHPAARLLATARTSPYWRVSEMPGPVPWLSPDSLDAARENLTDTEYQRDVLNIWATGDDLLTDPDDLAACIDTARRPLDYDPANRRYVIGVDGAITGDNYAIVTCHAERAAPGAPAVVVIDRIDTFVGTRAHPIDLAAVGEFIVDLSRAYGHASVQADPAHIMETVQRLKRAGVMVSADQRTVANNHAAATSLYRLLRSRRLRLPDDEDLHAELLRVRLRESSPGKFRLDAARGQGAGHGDRASALSYAALPLANTAEPGRVLITVPGLRDGRKIERTLHDARPTLPTRIAAERARRDGPRGVNFIVGVPGAYDDPERLDGVRH